MNEFYINIDPNRKNFLFVTKEVDGRAQIVHDCKTDEELAGVCDYWDYNALSMLEVGKSCDCPDGFPCVALRIS